MTTMECETLNEIIRENTPEFQEEFNRYLVHHDNAIHAVYKRNHDKMVAKAAKFARLFTYLLFVISVLLTGLCYAGYADGFLSATAVAIAAFISGWYTGRACA